LRRDLARLRDERIGRLAHGAHHHDDAVAGAVALGDEARHLAQALDGGDRAAAVFLDDDGGHGSSRVKWQSSCGRASRVARARARASSYPGWSVSATCKEESPRQISPASIEARPS